MGSYATFLDEPVLFISPTLSAQDSDMVAQLLAVAAGQTNSYRELTPSQYEFLGRHRVLSLAPSSWRAPAGIDLAKDKLVSTALQLKLIAEAKIEIQRLETAGIDHRVLKGLASCELDYADAAMRTFGDIDLLVHQRDFDRAIEVLVAGGAQPPPANRFGYRFSHAASLVNRAGYEVDLHYRLIRFGAINGEHLDSLFDDPVSLSWGGRALPAELRLLHAASHFICAQPGHRRLSGLADVTAIRAKHCVNLDTTRHYARLFGIEAPVGFALALERTLRDLPVDTDHWEAPSPLERASYLRPDRQLAMEHAHAFVRSPNRIRYLAHQLFPSAERAERRGGYRQYFRRVLPRRFGGQHGPVIR